MMPPNHWEDYFKSKMTIPDSFRQMMPEIADLMIFDYILCNTDRGVKKNNYAIRCAQSLIASTTVNGRGGRRQWLGSGAPLNYK